MGVNRTCSHLKGAVVLDCPDAHGNGEDRDEDERYKDESPEVPIILKVVTGKHLKDEEQQLQEQADDHCLVMDLAIPFIPS